ncbi:MAG: hypothetical protein V4719_11000 [Planctomycetota bacterium]
MDNKRRVSWGRWFAIVGALLFIAYPLSLGPVFYFTQGTESDEVMLLYSLYTPLELLGQYIPAFHSAMDVYLSFWMHHDFTEAL